MAPTKTPVVETYDPKKEEALKAELKALREKKAEWYKEHRSEIDAEKRKAERAKYETVANEIYAKLSKTYKDKEIITICRVIGATIRAEAEADAEAEAEDTPKKK